MENFLQVPQPPVMHHFLSHQIKIYRKSRTSHSIFNAFFSQELLQPRAVVPAANPLQAKCEPLNVVEVANVPRMIFNKDIIDITGEAGQQQQLEAPMIVLEELENVAMTLMNGESGKPNGEVVAANQSKTYSCEKCRMKFNTFQTLQDHNFSFKMMHSRVL